MLAPMLSKSSRERDLTEAAVPTGIKMGRVMFPWGVESVLTGDMMILYWYNRGYAGLCFL